MALPKQNAVMYSLTLPSNGKEIKYRPFLVKDEKSLLVAQQSEDMKVMVNSLLNVIKSCVDGDINTNDLSTFDVEYLFTQIRAKSVGEIANLNLKCDTCTDEKAVAKVDIDLTKVEVKKAEDHTNKIELFDDVGVIMKYPSFALIEKIQNADNASMDELFNIVISCMESIYNTNEIFHVKEQTKDELIDFLNNLSSEQFGKIQRFFETLPKMSQQIEYDCPVCNKHHSKLLEGLQSFF